MRKTAVILSALILCHLASAAPIDRQTACTAGAHFLQQLGLMKVSETLAFNTSYFSSKAAPSVACFYVFNLNQRGFVLVSADDRSTPILGYSMNGPFDSQNLPINVQSWLNGYADEIGQGIANNAPENPAALKQWKELTNGNPAIPPSPKSEEYLLTSTWSQGSGYNDFCPKWGNEHVVVGCIATAMAQIIRYHGYPSRGFGNKSYHHESYGVLSVNFDTSEYDYSLMPDRIRRSSSTEQRNMVSRLCYHCGVTVNMRYQNPNHTSGSGAYTNDVPDALMHFGYTDAQFLSRSNLNNDSLWVALIENEIDNLRPIEYSGNSADQGGHAFVLDGYNNYSQYHFNWGWSGSYDGFYTLTTMVGFVGNHEMVINIKPSGWDGHLTRFYATPEGDGGGTSFEDGNCNIAAAVKLNKLVQKDIWMKEGIYYGDPSKEYAFNLTGSAAIYGGFAGNETSLSQRNIKAHPTILDGANRQGILCATCSEAVSRSLSLNGIVLQNGNGHDSLQACLLMQGNVRGSQLEVRYCRGDRNIVYLQNSLITASQFHSNQAPVICGLSNGKLRQSLINNNQGDAADLLNSSRIINCDIACNTGVGARLNSNRSILANNIIWNNDTAVVATNGIADSCIRYNAMDIVVDSLADSTCIRLDSDNAAANGPRFIQPTQARGPQGMQDDADWHLMRGSICIDAGERISESLQDGDMDRTIRCRNGVIDLGCYESNYPVSILTAETSPILVYPNPTARQVTIQNGSNQEIKLYNAEGMLLLQQRGNAPSETLDLSAFPNGLYLLQIGNQTIKIIKH